jgi:hypothetical protein
MDEHLSHSEEAKTACQIGEASHFLLEARVREDAFYDPWSPPWKPTSSDSYNSIHIVPILLHFTELTLYDFV